MNQFWTSLASILGALAFFQTILHSLLPPQLRSASLTLLLRLTRRFSSFCYFDIAELDGFSTNELYNAVQIYLSNSPSITSGRRIGLSRQPNSSSFTFSLSAHDQLLDTFRGATASWEHVVTDRRPQNFSWRPVPDEKRCFTLCIKRKDRPLILNSYLNHIMERASEIRRKNQDRFLYTNSRGSIDPRGLPWESVLFKHPSTFETIAIELEKKAEIMADLKAFAEGEEFYRKTGRAWKRGYLLFGPPGTGKSSLIAAMANFLGYDIYDLELTEVRTNSELRKLLMKTTAKSIIVIEDIDCSINLTSRSSPKKQFAPRDDITEAMPGEESARTITLSGLLNFTDGLWSCCGNERIFVFTTNHIEKLDPALLRSGRMDMHIHMSYCSYPALRILMKNYLDLEDFSNMDDKLMKELEEVIGKAQMTPADVSELLIKNRLDRLKAMKELLECLKKRAEIRCAECMKNSNDEEGEEEEQEKRALETTLEEENGIAAMEDQKKVRAEELKKI